MDIKCLVYFDSHDLPSEITLQLCFDSSEKEKILRLGTAEVESRLSDFFGCLPVVLFSKT